MSASISAHVVPVSPLLKAPKSGCPCMIMSTVLWDYINTPIVCVQSFPILFNVLSLNHLSSRFIYTLLPSRVQYMWAALMRYHVVWLTCTDVTANSVVSIFMVEVKQRRQKDSLKCQYVSTMWHAVTPHKQSCLYSHCWETSHQTSIYSALCSFLAWTYNLLSYFLLLSVCYRTSTDIIFCCCFRGCKINACTFSTVRWW